MGGDGVDHGDETLHGDDAAGVGATGRVGARQAPWSDQGRVRASEGLDLVNGGLRWADEIPETPSASFAHTELDHRLKRLCARSTAMRPGAGLRRSALGGRWSRRCTRSTWRWSQVRGGRRPGCNANRSSNPSCPGNGMRTSMSTARARSESSSAGRESRWHAVSCGG